VECASTSSWRRPDVDRNAPSALAPSAWIGQTRQRRLERSALERPL
jgi:hypothetical protein